jgi:hypothetical protein
MGRKSTSAATHDDFGLLSAIWILSCNDQIPYMTYEGIKQRLGLPREYDVRILIAGHGELFRARVPNERLNKWKAEMLAGQRFPSWIREKADLLERRAAIEGLTPEDLFRNQFRTEADAPRADLEVIRWGLEHVESLRSAQAESQEAKVKKWTSMRIPILSTIVALVAVISGALLQWANIQTQRQTQQQTLETQRQALDTQRQLKYYEVELKPKLEGYSTLMNSMRESLKNADQRDGASTSASLDRARVAFYNIEPFLNYDEQEGMFEDFEKFIVICHELAGGKTQPFSSPEKRRREATALFVHLQDRLFEQLFAHQRK